MQVAIIEDDPLLAADLKTQFERRGWIVTGLASDSGSGRSLIERTSPDLVMLDVDLEDGPTGPDLSAPAKKVGSLVVFLTGRASLIGEELAKNHPVLSKPYTDLDIAMIIQQSEDILGRDQTA